MRRARWTSETGSELERPEPRPAKVMQQSAEDVAEVLRRSVLDGTTASIQVQLGDNSPLNVAGRVRALDGRYVEIIEPSGRTRRLVLSLVRAARIVPNRSMGKPSDHEPEEDGR